MPNKSQKKKTQTTKPKMSRKLNIAHKKKLTEMEKILMENLYLLYSLAPPNRRKKVAATVAIIASNNNTQITQYHLLNQSVSQSARHVS